MTSMRKYLKSKLVLITGKKKSAALVNENERNRPQISHPISYMPPQGAAAGLVSQTNIDPASTQRSFEQATMHRNFEPPTMHRNYEPPTMHLNYEPPTVQRNTSNMTTQGHVISITTHRNTDPASLHWGRPMVMSRGPVPYDPRNRRHVTAHTAGMEYGLRNQRQTQVAPQMTPLAELKSILKKTNYDTMSTRSDSINNLNSIQSTSSASESNIPSRLAQQAGTSAYGSFRKTVSFRQTVAFREDQLAGSQRQPPPRQQLATPRPPLPRVWVGKKRQEFFV